LPASLAAPSTAEESSPEPLPRRVYSTAFGISIRTKSQPDWAVTPAKKVFYTIIKTSLLIPGDGPPLRDGALVIEDKLIAWLGPAADLPAKYTDAKHRSFAIPYIMPGLWDCHVHCGGEGEDDDSLTSLTQHPATAGARVARGCWEALQRGYTSLRDVAGYGCEVSKAIDDGTIVGPNIYASGACLSQLAGHGDVFGLPAGDVLLNWGVSNIGVGHWGAAISCVVDGVDECRRGVRLQVRRGARCIKVFASGGVMSRDDDVRKAQFSKEELECIVNEAARQGLSVAAHVHGKDGILQAVRAGVATVEHVSLADDECLELIKEKGTIYIATRTVNELLLETGGEGLTRQTWEKAKLVSTNHLVAYKKAIKAGITCALGTDTGPGFNMAIELDYAVQAGMSNLEAIKAATANGPLSVGEKAPKTGQLKVGYEADILGLKENPVEDVKVLQRKDVIEFVWKGGVLYKGPGVGPWGEIDDPHKW
jgi:imidazolonepropionase-like amidohydrolase